MANSKNFKKSIGRYLKEDPKSKDSYCGSFILSNTEQKLKWKYIKKKINNDLELRQKYGYSTIGDLENSKIVNMMIKICYDLFKNEDFFIKQKLINLKKSILLQKLILKDD